MDKQLKYGKASVMVSAPAGGSLFTGGAPLPLEFDERAGEVVRIKSLETMISLTVPSAGYSVVMDSYVLRHEMPDHIYPDGNVYGLRPSDILDQFTLVDTDSFNHADERYTPSRKQCPRFVWPDGMEPYILYRCPHQIVCSVWVNLHPSPPNSVIVVFRHYFRYWIERPTDKEFERLARAYGRVS